MLEQQTRLRVLIADDIADVRHDLRLLLEIYGVVDVVAVAADGQEAIDQSAVLRPDVVVLDLAMPVLDGYQAASRIKSELTGSRVVALTVHQDGASREKALAAGFDAFVVKGAPLEELLGAIGSLGVKESHKTGGLS
jgi:CheY-like chemotaxis protein